MANTALNRTGQLLLTNKSGGAVAQGDVVVVDTTTAASFTTTTTSGYVGGSIGVVIEPNGIANNGIGMVAVQGYVPIINLSGTGSIGDMIKTHTVAKQGVRNAAPAVAGNFAQALGTSATPVAILWGIPYFGSGSGVTRSGATTDGHLAVWNGSSADSIKDGGVAFADGTWTDYTATSTVVGWSSFTNKYIYYKTVGKTVFVAYELTGASNNATTTFTVPVAAAAAPPVFVWFDSASDNGGAYTTGYSQIAAGASLVQLYKNAAIQAFSATGTKEVYGQFWYVTA